MEEPSMDSTTGTFTFSEIVEITSDFGTKIGEGGFGNVYFGTLKDGTDVAVKVLRSPSEQGRKAVLAEAKLLTDVYHENLVSLVGYCDGNDNEALVYDFMANGSLKQYLSEESETILNWNERLQVALDVAYGLEYLHGCKPSIVHRDLKPDNILFNENMQAKIADFGLSRAFGTDSASHISTYPAGTFGYIDPHVFRTGRTSKTSDVYSFGVILLQLVTGKPAVIRRDTEESINIIHWVDPLFKKRDIQSIVDPRLNGEFNINAARKVIKIAMSCVMPTITERPDMSHVQAQLKQCLDIEMQSRQVNETGWWTNILDKIYKNSTKRQKEAIMKPMEERVTVVFQSNVRTSNSSVSEVANGKESGPSQDGEHGMKSRNSTLVAVVNQVEAEWIEQYGPGVYITLVALQDGTRDLKRVRFSRKRFGEHQAKTWWSENREKVYERYNVRGWTNCQKIGGSSLTNFSNIATKEAIMKPMEERPVEEQPMKSMEDQPVNSRNIIFTYSEIAEITLNFKTVIGEGKFGKVYLGTLNDGAHVAVEVLSHLPTGGYDKFRAEVEKYSLLYHKNVVSLVGYCAEDGIKALIHEYVANGNLKQYLSEKCKRILSWNERLQIAVDVANGLKHLRRTGSLMVRNLDATDIFLNEDMQAKIGYFFINEIINDVDPLYFCPGALNYAKDNRDNFRMTLLELLTGRSVSCDHICSEKTFVMRATMEKDIQSIVDPRLQGKFNIIAARKFAELAVSCATCEWQDMSEVLEGLKVCLTIETSSEQSQI